MRNAALGALAGLVGGLVFGAVMAQIGFLPTVAALVRADSPALGFAVHLLIAAVIGAIFGVLVARQQELLLWGLAYGFLWWFLGPLTLLPVLLGDPVAWDVATARALIPSLLGHLAYGAATVPCSFFWQAGKESSALNFLCLPRSPESSSPPCSASPGGPSWPGPARSLVRNRLR
ncbi:hypothetical protein [Streptomyces sp. NPDC020681]|uniref:hypothetical protein n=1 Tax=Streptomyces sp. NPDC020681 TaxID=3365083 RepID=UPI00378B6503